MPGFFNSRSGSSVRNYHYYVPSDKKLHDIGLASYTRNSLDKFGKRRRNGQDENDPDISEYFSNGLDSIRTRFTGDGATLIIYRFEKDTKRYLYTTNTGTDEENIFWTPSGVAGEEGGGVVFGSNLQTFQEKFDLYQKGWIKEDGATSTERFEAYNVKYIWSKVNNSLSGCINFNINNYSILTRPSSGVVSLFLQSKGDGNDRSIAFQPPIIAGVGATATGKEHAFNLSEDLGPGALSAPDVGGIKNPNNTVAGPLNLHFNRGTGKWESGTTQTYCKVLDDIPGVPLTDLPNNVDFVDNESLKIPFNSGWAMVMNTEKGNPHMMVPNSFGCITSEKEKIVIINRSIRSYVKGEVCLASQINGDWVPVPLNNGVSVAKKLTIDWSQIQKYIVNAKGFFRNRNDTQFLEPSNYQDHVRSRFYNTLSSTSFTENTAGNDLSKLRLLNLYYTGNSDINYSLSDNGSVDMDEINNATINTFTSYSLNNFPSLNYMQFYDADIIPKNLGGNNAGPCRLRNTIISRTDPIDEDTGVGAESVPVSWGMYFPNGYSSAGVTRIKSITSATSANPSMKIYNPSAIEVNSYTIATQNDKLNLKDAYFYHMPAQIALNSSINQTIEIGKLGNALNKTQGAYCDNLINYMKDPIKGDWIKTGSKNMYGLGPVDSTNIQFTPLSLELALSSTSIADEGLGSQGAVNGGYKNLKQNLLKIGAATPEYFKSEGKSEGFFGGAWTRMQIPSAKLEDDGSIYGSISFGRRLFNFGEMKAGETNFEATIGPPKRGDTPDGGPDLLPATRNESSNVMGIIGTKGTFSLPNGGTLELKTSNMFGMLAYTRSTISNGGFSSFFTGLSLFIQDLSGQNRSSDIVQWGGSLGIDQIKELGSTALWCAVYDHCPNTIYDSRYFTPLQFNPSGTSVDFEEVDLPVNTPIRTQKTIPTRKNKIRRNMLLTNGGFTYVKKIIAANVPVIEKAGEGYAENTQVTFNLGGKPAKFLISKVTGNGGISELILDIDNEGLDAYGETSNDGTGNPFYADPLVGNLPINIFPDDPAKQAVVKMYSGKVIEKLMTDKLNFYGAKKITPEDNNGEGNDRGFITGTKTTTFALTKNNTGKYDIFLFFANDILNYPEAGVLWEGYPAPPARYINLEITSI
jgi:hypothetical protein